MITLRVKPALIITLIIFLLTVPYSVFAETNAEQKMLSDATNEIIIKGADFDFQENAEAIAYGENPFKAENIMSRLIDLFLKFFKDNLGLLIKLTVLCIFSGIVSALSETDSSQVIFIAMLALVFSIAFDILKNSLVLAETTIDNLLIFMQSLLPSVLMLSSKGMSALSVSFQPALFASIQSIVFISKEWFLPMILFTSVLSAINSMTARFHITKLLQTCNLFIKWGLGLLMTVYVALLAICGFTGAIQAGAISKTVKYAIASFIPMVGGVLAESAESVLLSMSLIRNAVGITGIVAVLFLSVTPLLNLLATSVVFRLVVSIAEPASEKRIIKLLSGFASSISLVFSILLAVCVMLIISIAMLISLTNFVTVMR
ncbi:MAG: hypothetical protein E7407_03605 [Ruminococcaceae bacterium]|nr:hypothetical protein [Oscillospiraceae bacterium]